MAHNTTYHQLLKCTPTEMFQGRIPYNASDLKFSNSLQINRNKVQLRTLVDEFNQNYEDTTANICEVFYKYKNYHDGKIPANH